MPSILPASIYTSKPHAILLLYYFSGFGVYLCFQNGVGFLTPMSVFRHLL